MLISISVIIMSGLFLGWGCKKIRFPSLFGMIIAGMIIGPGMLDLIAPSILDISTEIRKIALIVILIRAGLKLNLEDLKKVGRPAILMCFVPACFEIVGMVVLAPMLLGVSILDAAIIGAVIGAVSPAVIVPRMIKLIDEGYGTDQYPYRDSYRYDDRIPVRKMVFNGKNPGDCNVDHGSFGGICIIGV